MSFPFRGSGLARENNLRQNKGTELESTGFFLKGIQNSPALQHQYLCNILNKNTIHQLCRDFYHYTATARLHLIHSTGIHTNWCHSQFINPNSGNDGSNTAKDGNSGKDGNRW